MAAHMRIAPSPKQRQLLNKGNCCTAVCNTGYLNMLYCRFKGVKHLSQAHRRALADGAKQGLTCSCSQFALLWVRSKCLSSVILQYQLIIEQAAKCQDHVIAYILQYSFKPAT